MMGQVRVAYLTFVRQSNKHLLEECLTKQRLDLTQEGPVTRPGSVRKKETSRETPLRLFFFF